MDYHALSGTGLRVSKICLGTASFGVAPTEADTTAVVHHALDAGINFIDTASSYGNQSRFDRDGAPPAADRPSAETLVGRAIAGRRDEVVLATKVSEPIGTGPNDGGSSGGGLSRAHIMRLVERSLERLGTDHIDIFYAHHPDPITRVEEWIRAFDDLITQGKIRYYALSTFAGWQLTEAVLTAARMGATRPACHQTRYNVARRWPESEVLPASNHFGIDSTVFSPLGGGLLTGTTDRRYAGDARWGGRSYSGAELALAENFSSHARKWGIPENHLAVAWLLTKPGVASAIVGPESIAELDALAGSSAVRLSSEQVEALDDLASPPPGPWD
jgi:aryl-alcohol dehydrogenase-like predicted oxidoreductase